jgi:hypothetical protein
MPPVGRPCKPGCKCKRHTAVHKPDCKCVKCKPRPPRPDDYIRPSEKREDRCKCGHIERLHDAFGCGTCAKRGQLCKRFKQHDTVSTVKEKGYEREVAAAGFVGHSHELATCINCWTTVKIGFAHSVSSVINATAHKQKCEERRQKLVNSDRPNRVG